MSFIVEQKIKGNIYLYEVQSYWDPDKKQARQKRKYIGKKDPTSGETITPIKSNAPRFSRNFGPIFLLHNIAKDIGLESTLLTHFGEEAKQIMAWAFFKVIEGKAGYLYQEWWEDNFLPYQVPAISSQALSRWMAALERQDKQRNDFFCSWVKQNQNGRALWFDITSFSSHSEKNTWCEWGYNRDGEHLPQVNLGMVMGMSTGLPLFYQLYPGSISDVTTLKNVAYQAKSWGVTLDTFVVDRGFYSAANLAFLNDLGLHFIMPLPLTVKLSQTLLTEVKNELTSPLNSFSYQGQPLFAVRKTIESNGRTLYATIYFDEQRFSNESNRFYRRLHELECYIEQTDFFSIQHVEDALEASWQGSRRYFNIALTTDSTVKLRRKRNAITWRLNRMGRMILISDQCHEAHVMLEWYRNKDQIEKVFDTLKNQMDERRIRVHSPENMQGKLFLNFIATVLYSALLQRMKSSNLHKKMCVPELLLLLKKWRTIQFQKGNQRFTEISKKQRTVLNALKVKIPINPSY